MATNLNRTAYCFGRICCVGLIGLSAVLGCQAPSAISNQDGRLDPEAVAALSQFLQDLQATGNFDIDMDGIFEVGQKMGFYFKAPIRLRANGQMGPVMRIPSEGRADSNGTD